MMFGSVSSAHRAMFSTFPWESDKTKIRIVILFLFSIPGLYKETVEKAMISGYNRERKGGSARV